MEIRRSETRPQEIYLNVITTTVILLILSVVDRYIRL